MSPGETAGGAVAAAGSVLRLKYEEVQIRARTALPVTLAAARVLRLKHKIKIKKPPEAEEAEEAEVMEVIVCGAVKVCRAMTRK